MSPKVSLVMLCIIWLCFLATIAAGLAWNMLFGIGFFLAMCLHFYLIHPGDDANYFKGNSNHV